MKEKETTCLVEKAELNGEKVTVYVPSYWRLGVSEDKKLLLFILNRDTTTNETITFKAFHGAIFEGEDGLYYHLKALYRQKTSWYRGIKSRLPRMYAKLLNLRIV